MNQNITPLYRLIDKYIFGGVEEDSDYTKEDGQIDTRSEILECLIDILKGDDAGILKKLGVNIKNEAGEFRNVSDVLSDLSEIYRGELD